MRINSYYKSSKKYWQERNRRKQVLELIAQGLTYHQIAEQLGISERTAKRDYAKIKPYYERIIHSRIFKLEEQRRAKIQAQLEGMTLIDRFEFLGKLLTHQRYQEKAREYLRHQLIITIN
jgi:FixJ family two-component response regulator